MQLTRNFNSVYDNMACPCCNGLVYEMPFLNRVQILRDLMAIPFHLDKKGGGFYRCRIYNDSIGGAKNSQHLHGRAMDVSTHGWTGFQKWQFVHEATKLGLSIGIYDRWFHIDLRPGNPVVFYGNG